MAAKGWALSPEAPPGSEFHSVCVPDGLRIEGACELPSAFCRLAPEGSLPKTLWRTRDSQCGEASANARWWFPWASA